MNQKDAMNIEEALIISKKMQMYINEEKNQLESIEKSCSNLLNIYVSSQQTKFIESNNTLSNEIEKILAKRVHYMSTLITYVNAFNDTSLETKIMISNAMKGNERL